ncbi:MAG: sigma-70 family RNA polymerase sigma factor [Chloroflexi bacterium]|nr:sigma-70 family RNA polymerase sigma factor [Chloroflexota bacterium]
MSADESRLLRRARRNDSEAWSHIYDLYYPRIYAFMLARIRDSMLAEDLAADVFVNALRAINTYEERGLAFIAWLYRIAHNRLIDHYRRSGRTGTDSLDEMDETGDRLDDKAITTSGGLDLERIDLQQAVGRLTAEQQQIVQLRFVEGMTSEQVATVMSKSVAAVKIMQHRALKALKQSLHHPSNT